MISEQVPAIYSGIACLSRPFRLPTNSSEEAPTVRPAIAILKGAGINSAATPSFASLYRKLTPFLADVFPPSDNLQSPYPPQSVNEFATPARTPHRSASPTAIGPRLGRRSRAEPTGLADRWAIRDVARKARPVGRGFWAPASPWRLAAAKDGAPCAHATRSGVPAAGPIPHRPTSPGRASRMVSRPTR